MSQVIVSVEVNTCSECPYVADGWGNCNHPKSLAENPPYGRSLLKAVVEHGIPDWCPARTAAPAETDRLQARIDALMLEYCPDEITPEQLANWEKHQRAVPADAIMAGANEQPPLAPQTRGTVSERANSYRAEVLAAAAQCGDWDGVTCEMNEAGLLSFAALVTDRYERALRHLAETGFASKDWQFAKFVLDGLSVEEARQKAEDSSIPRQDAESNTANQKDSA